MIGVLTPAKNRIPANAANPTMPPTDTPTNKNEVGTMQNELSRKSIQADITVQQQSVSAVRELLAFSYISFTTAHIKKAFGTAFHITIPGRATKQNGKNKTFKKSSLAV